MSTPETRTPSNALADALRGLVEGEAAFAETDAALAAGRRVALGGVPGGAATLVVAALGRRRPLIVVAPSEDQLGALEEDLRALLGEGGRPILKNPPLELADDEPQGDDEELELSLPGSGVGARLRVVQALAETPAPILLTGASALLERVPPPASRSGDSPAGGGPSVLTIQVGATLDAHALASRLARIGWVRVPLVEAPGELAIRGGIVDLYPLGAASPVRLELDGERVERLRRFDAASQRSSGAVDKVHLSLVSPQDWLRARRASESSLLAHLPPGAAVVLLEPKASRERLAQTAARFAERAADLLSPAQVEDALRAAPLVLLGEAKDEEADPLTEGAADIELPFESADLAAGRDPHAVTNELARLVARGERLTVAALTDAEREHLTGLLTQGGLTPTSGEALRTSADPPGVTLVTWPLDAGFRHARLGVWLVASHRLFARHRRGEAGARRPRGRGAVGATIESFADLEEGQPVVHVTHGIALFRGITRRERDGQPRDFLILEFDGGTLYIPTDRIGLVRRYVGPSGAPPKLSRIGGAGWKGKTKKAEAAVRDLAAELLEIQAERAVRPGQAFPPDDKEQTLFEESFGYTDTEDQARIAHEVKQDLQRPLAMDRLVCGDVGYGKTEIAVRAAFKVASAGFQVAVLVPTTILAHQHHRVFSERMAAYPLRLDVLSRFRSPAEQKLTLRGLASGAVDIVIGTHRLLSKDVELKNLGLVVIDEEQRFGVEHKERLKALRRTVHVLTLSATPIPRTLHFALSGARDISLLQTPPPGRAPVETKVVRFSRGLIKRAIERELARDGQVFVVHDRVKSIDVLAELIKDAVPTARVLVVHGQLPEHEIEERMLAFVEHQADVLVATTLIENGLDVRRANTLLVDRAQNYGLAELHQLRGRVGRSDVHAHAFMLLPEHGGLSDVAARRLRAIEEFTDLGAGFQIAMRDLEIRGAGNVLGAEQSGHIADVGYDLYCRLLKRAMAELRAGQAAGKAGAAAAIDLERDLDLEAGEVELVLDIPAFVPDAYVADVGLKIECYRKLASAEREDELTDLEKELADRYGPVPDALQNLFKLRRARIRAAGHGVVKVTRQDRVLQLRCRSRERLQAVIRPKHHDRVRAIDETMLYVVLPDATSSDGELLELMLDLLRPLDDAEATALEAAESKDAAAAGERRKRLKSRGRRRGRGRGSGAA